MNAENVLFLVVTPCSLVDGQLYEYYGGQGLLVMW